LPTRLVSRPSSNDLDRLDDRTEIFTGILLFPQSKLVDMYNPDPLAVLQMLRKPQNQRFDVAARRILFEAAWEDTLDHGAELGCIYTSVVLQNGCMQGIKYMIGC
jgi:hypothetical protein